jgi:AraC-like DNA-binding protein
MTEPRPKKGKGAQAKAGFSRGRVSAVLRRFEASIAGYLEDCYRTRTVARVSELALRIGLSRQRLVEMVWLGYGKTPADLLRDRQLEYAIDLLTGTSLPLSDIAAASAFGDRSTLYRAFMRKYGMSPFHFRHLDNMQRSKVLQAR